MGNIIAIFDTTFLVFHNANKPTGFTEQYLFFRSQILVIKVFSTPYTDFWYETLRNWQLIIGKEFYISLQIQKSAWYQLWKTT